MIQFIVQRGPADQLTECHCTDIAANNMASLFTGLSHMPDHEVEVLLEDHHVSHLFYGMLSQQGEHITNSSILITIIGQDKRIYPKIVHLMESPCEQESK